MDGDRAAAGQATFTGETASGWQQVTSPAGGDQREHHLRRVLLRAERATTRRTTRTSTPPRRWGRIPPSLPWTARRCRHCATPTAPSTASTPTPAPPHSRQIPLRLLIIGSMSYSKPQQDLLRRQRQQRHTPTQLRRRRQQLLLRLPQQLLLRRQLHRRQLQQPQLQQRRHATATPTPTIQVTVQTNLAGLSFSVDDITYNSTQTFSWVPGRATPLPQLHRRTVPQGFVTCGLVGLMAELSLTPLRLPPTRPTQRISTRNIS